MNRDELFAALARRDPEQIILHGTDSGWNRVAMQAAMTQLQGLLSELGNPMVVAVLADNSPAWVIADLALLEAGIAHLPLPAFFTPEQIAHALQQTGTGALLTDQPERIRQLGLGFVPAGIWCDLIVMQRDTAALALPPGTAKISFTSGSTGKPKGVCLSANGLLETARAVSTRLADLPLTRHLAVLPLALLLENVAGVYASLLQGATIHLPYLPTLGWQGISGFNPAALHGTVVARRASSVILVPELLKAWALYLGHTNTTAPTDLVYAAVGGSRVDKELLAEARTYGLPVYQGYGLTECGSVVSLNRPGNDGDDVGQPLDHVRIRVDSNGEIHVTANAFLAYLNDAPAAMGSEYATGDLGAFAGNGHLQLSGRRKNLLINSYGRNISPEWVEAALLAEPAIYQAMATGDGRPWLAALLVPTPGADPAALAAAVARVNQGLPDYARIGDWLTVAAFTPANGMLTGNGRPVRTRILEEHGAALAALYAERESKHAVL